MKTILLDHDVDSLNRLEKLLIKYFSDIVVVAKSNKLSIVQGAICKHIPDLVILNLDTIHFNFGICDRLTQVSYKTIYTSSTYGHASQAINNGATGYITKPLKEEEVVAAINHTINSIRGQKGDQNSSNQTIRNDLIYVPTTEGAEILFPSDIIRCEGLQKCTRIITTGRSDIISSYHIGMYSNLLLGLGFIQPHRSHIINMRYVRKYHREGTIYMSDNSTVPVSRRKKKELFNGARFPHRIPLIPRHDRSSNELDISSNHH